MEQVDNFANFGNIIDTMYIVLFGDFIVIKGC